jgi:trinucleotide repeat-containing gene 6 protein
MAVQAGHLNAQILNQPLAPQTLLLLNQLLQQIKALQQCQQQHAMAVQAAGARGGAGANNPSSNQALLHISVQITKHKQQITNLQNQITAQQAQYLKNQQQQQHQPPMGGGGMPVPDGGDLSLSLGNLALSGGDHSQQQQQQAAAGGSKLTKWIKSGDASASGNPQQDPDFSRAPGSSKSNNSQQPSPNILLDPSGPWSNGNNGAAAATSGGWPDSSNSSDKNINNGGMDVEPDFGIPEFVPGKAWKGTTIKDPSEDPTLTPGSVATTPIMLHQQQQQGEKPSVSHSSSSIATTMMENSLGLASSTWSFGSSAKESAMQVSCRISYNMNIVLIKNLPFLWKRYLIQTHETS